MMEDFKRIKDMIDVDWVQTFPQLTKFGYNKYYKIVGPIILGIELIKLPHSDAYRPYFVVYPLWQKDLKTCFSGPVILLQTYNKKGLPFSIPYTKHNDFFKEAVDCFKKQIPISMNNDISVNILFELIDKCFNDILVKSNSAEQARLYELKLNIALYLDDEEQIKNILDCIKNESKNWNMQMFEIWYGEFDTWLQYLYEKMNKKIAFLEQIIINKQDKKLKNLKKSELVMQ